MPNKRELDIRKSLKELAEEGWTADDLLDTYCEQMGIKRKNESISLTKLVSKTIHEIGIPAHVSGYQYVAELSSLQYRIGH